ncbi:exosortase family protein XrtF [Flavicella sp.]|uniref:exosortase family protein XrtF n=1 Tax=Flavicella sp. TaxID=2957742 RepID=UPI00301A0092
MSKRKKILKFLVKFFGAYFLFFGIYSYYLFSTQKKVQKFECSPITYGVAEQTISVLTFFGYDVKLEQHTEELSIKLLFDDVYLARVIEGCNSLSVIILFVSLIIAFSGSFWKTLFFALFGSVVIYCLNILRISFLTVALAKFPEQKEILHNLVFPSLIYGLVFLLWVIWVNYFSNYNENRNEKNN